MVLWRHFPHLPESLTLTVETRTGAHPRVELLLVCFSCEASDSVPFASSLGVSFATYIFKVDTVPFVLACPREDPALKVPNAQMGSLTKTYFKVSNL